jgi:hypothetical protein
LSSGVLSRGGDSSRGALSSGGRLSSGGNVSGGGASDLEGSRGLQRAERRVCDVAIWKLGKAVRVQFGRTRIDEVGRTARSDRHFEAWGNKDQSRGEREEGHAQLGLGCHQHAPSAIAIHAAATNRLFASEPARAKGLLHRDSGLLLFLQLLRLWM